MRLPRCRRWSQKEPAATYLVLGQTHPVIKRKEGEWYRESLVKQVAELGLTRQRQVR